MVFDVLQSNLANNNKKSGSWATKQVYSLLKIKAKQTVYFNLAFWEMQIVTGWRKSPEQTQIILLSIGPYTMQAPIRGIFQSSDNFRLG